MGNKLKIAYLVNIPSPYRIDFFNELGKTCDLTVFFERNTSDERNAAWYNKNFENFKAIFLEGIKIKGNNALCLGVTRFLKRSLFDVFVIGGYSTPTGMLAIEILRLKRIPFVLNTDGGMIKSDSSLKYKIKKHFISSASYWLSTGSMTNDYLINYGADSNRIFKYPFSSIFKRDVVNFPVKKIDKQVLKTQLQITEEKIILSVGRFIHSKGFDILLRACENIPKSYGVIIVGGQPTDEYLNLMKELNLTNVYFIDFQSKEDLRKYYLLSDLFVLPTRGDVWGLVINEAMSYSLPVITTNKCVAGLELIKDKENGFIVPLENISILTKCITLVLEDQMLANKMSSNNIEVIKEFTLEKMVAKHIEFFNTIISKGEKN